MHFERIKERIIWTSCQVFSIRHFIGMFLFLVLFTCNASEIPIEKLLMTIIFIVFCTYEQLVYALVSGIFIGIIIGVFPFLSIVIPLLIIAGVVKNYQFIWKNKYAVYLSLTVVMAPSEILDVILGKFYVVLKMPVMKVFEFLRTRSSIFKLSAQLEIPHEYIVVLLFFNLMMISLYLMKYSTKEAFTAIGVLPLLLLALIIPAVMQEISGAITASSYDSAYNTNPGVQDISGYYRTSKNGNTHYVDSHIRTKADGIEYNNISYKGK